MLIRTLSTTLLEIFFEIILNFQVIVKSIKDPEDNFKKISEVLQLIASKNFRYCSVTQFIHFTNRLKVQSLTTKFQVLCLVDHFD